MHGIAADSAVILLFGRRARIVLGHHAAEGRVRARDCGQRREGFHRHDVRRWGRRASRCAVWKGPVPGSKNTFLARPGCFVTWSPFLWQGPGSRVAHPSAAGRPNYSYPGWAKMLKPGAQVPESCTTPSLPEMQTSATQVSSQSPAPGRGSSPMQSRCPSNRR